MMNNEVKSTSAFGVQHSLFEIKFLNLMTLGGREGRGFTTIQLSNGPEVSGPFSSSVNSPIHHSILTIHKKSLILAMATISFETEPSEVSKIKAVLKALGVKN